MTTKRGDTPMPRYVVLMASTMLALAACAVLPIAVAPPETTVATSVPRPLPGTCPELAKHQLNELEAHSITSQDNRKSLVMHQTDRFSVYLEDATYPLSELMASPEGMLGYVSNGSTRGPRCYPIMHEAITEGRILLKDRGFQLEVVIDNKAPVSTFPLH